MTQQDYQRLFYSVYDFIVRVFSFANEVVDFMNSNQRIGGIKLLGLTLVEPFTINMLAPSLTLIILIVVVGLIKLLNPF